MMAEEREGTAYKTRLLNSQEDLRANEQGTENSLHRKPGHYPEETMEHEAADAGSLAGWVGDINRYLVHLFASFP